MSDQNRDRSGSINRAYDPDNGWSNDIEIVLESIRHNSFVMSEHHKKNYHYFKGQLKYYKIPVIIISGLNSVIAVGLQPYLDQGIISASNCLLALLCGIIGSIELFLGISAGMESELVASKNFYLLAIQIYKTLMLDRERRPVVGRDFLEEVYSEYTKYYGSSALVTISKKTKDKLAQIPLAGGKNPSTPVPSEYSSDIESGDESKTPVSRVKSIVSPRKKKHSSFSVKPRSIEESYSYEKSPQVDVDALERGMIQLSKYNNMAEQGSNMMEKYERMAEQGNQMMEDSPFGVNSDFGKALKILSSPESDFKRLANNASENLEKKSELMGEKIIEKSLEKAEEIQETAMKSLKEKKKSALESIKEEE